MLSVLAAWCAFRPLTMALEPNPGSLEAGAAVAALGKGIDRVIQNDRYAVGRWSRGYIPRDAEDVIWLSPEMLTRWLGYLRANEGLGSKELKTRWGLLSDEMNGHLWFVIRLAALDKQDPLEFGADAQADTTDLSPVMIRIQAKGLDGKPLELPQAKVKVLAKLQSSDPGAVIAPPWFLFDPKFSPLKPAIPPDAPENGLGTNEGVCLLAETDLPPNLLFARELDVRIVSKRKIRIAKFPLLRQPFALIQSQDADRDVQRRLGAG
jgi:hypothetical protein